jgi:P pilus assembly chaperone PapD
MEQLMKDTVTPVNIRCQPRRIVAALLVILALSAASAVYVRAVSVSPMSVFMNHSSRTGTITLYNPNPLPEEIDISFAFGYPVSDSAGDVTVPLHEQAPDGEPSAVEWLRAFPRRLVLEPGQQQVVRILAQPPADLADGEYWSRVLVTATGGRPPVEQQVQPDVRVAITMRTIVVASLNYRKGRLRTGVDVTSNSLERTPEGLQFTLDMARRGEAAYLGRIRVQALDASNRVIEEQEDVVSVYRTLRRRFVFPDANGAVRVRYTLDTERPELGQSNIIAAPAVTATVDLR